MDEALVCRYWCHMCSQIVNPVMEVEMKCPFCQSGFVEEMYTATGENHETENETGLGLGSDRALSLWAPILLSMMGGGGGGGGGTRRRLSIRESEEEESEEPQRGESEQDGDLLTRRRRSSAAILQLLHSLRSGIMSEIENSGHESERERDNNQERVILINPFNQSITLQGSFGQSQSHNQTQSTIPGTLGDYLVGSGLELLFQHLAENDPNRYGTPPAKKEAVEAMPTVTIGENLQCSVCLEEFEIGHGAKEMPCKHKFHDGCILPWLELHSSCPVCRFQIPASEDAPKVEDGSGNRTENSVAGDGNGRSWLPIPWPFSGLFSLSGTPNVGNSLSSASESAASASGPNDNNSADEN